MAVVSLPDVPRPRPSQEGSSLPALQNGDHLDRPEFERRYLAMPEIKKAELIEGVVYMPSPVSIDNHGRQHGQVITWLGTYTAHTPGVEVGDNATVRLDLDNKPQPDALLIIAPAHGGRTTRTDGYVTGGPELVAEIAASSVSIDRNAKMNAYRRKGVCEYLLWRVEDRAIDWFVLRGGHFDNLPPGPDGILRSEVFPGLWLDVPALLAGNLLQVLAVLQNGLQTQEHNDFCLQLRSRPNP